MNSNNSQLKTNTVDIGNKINMRTRIYTPIFNSVIIYKSSVIVESFELLTLFFFRGKKARFAAFCQLNVVFD